MRMIRCDRCARVFHCEEQHSVLRIFDVRRDVIELDVLPAQGKQLELCGGCREAFDVFLTGVSA